MKTKVLGLSMVFLASFCLAHAQIPNPGTHLFESDFLGTSNEIYGDDTIRSLVEGWTGQRDPLGNHSGTSGYSNIGGGLLDYRGGQGGFSDKLFIRNTLSGIPAKYLFRAKFRRNQAHTDDRADFVILIGDLQFHVDSGPGHTTGIPGATAPFSLATGVWYNIEGIHRINGQVEIRVWLDSGARPASPLVVGTHTATQPALIQLTGSNFVSPEVTVDWVFIDSLKDIPTVSGLGVIALISFLSLTGIFFIILNRRRAAVAE